MPKFIIERHVPGASKLTDAEIREASLKSLEALRTARAGNPVDSQLHLRRQDLLHLLLVRTKRSSGTRPDGGPAGGSDRSRTSARRIRQTSRSRHLRLRAHERVPKRFVGRHLPTLRPCPLREQQDHIARKPDRACAPVSGPAPETGATAPVVLSECCRSPGKRERAGRLGLMMGQAREPLERRCHPSLVFELPERDQGVVEGCASRIVTGALRRPDDPNRRPIWRGPSDRPLVRKMQAPAS